MLQELLNAANVVGNSLEEEPKKVSEDIVKSADDNEINDYMMKISNTYFALSISNRDTSKLEKLLKEHMEVVTNFHCLLSGKKIENNNVILLRIIKVESKKKFAIFLLSVETKYSL